ncbi:MAG: dTDP-4-dehydrorhamnose 3,5-epimerase [Algicola sp.]|nr:dTDP-4-dehydrorhamnose 3,5-epimerase [Algicola sp.]
MIVKETALKGCFEIEPSVFNDHRGYFLETFNQQAFNQAIGQEVTFVQDNESQSTKGVLRGLHFQTGDHAQAKLVRVVKGKVLDVAVDLRPNSPTFCEHVKVMLSEENKKQLFVPRGFAHGFLVLSETAIFSYKCDNFYNKAAEAGIAYNDLTLNIDWEFPTNLVELSEKDLHLPTIEVYFK